MKRAALISTSWKPAVLVILVIAVAALTAQPSKTVAQDNKSESKSKVKNTKPVATVKVQVETNGEDSEQVGADAKSAPTVKVEVKPETEKKKSKVQHTLLPPPDKPIAPIETEAIDKAGKRVGQKIEEIGRQAACTLGSWVNAKSLWGITWLKLVFFSFALVGVFLLAWIVRVLIHWYLQRAYSSHGSTSWKPVFLETLQMPICLFIYVYGFYGALSLIFVDFEKPFGPNVLHDVAEKAADIGGGIALVWLAYGLVRIIEVRIAQRSGPTGGKSDDLLVSIVGKTLRMATVFIGGILILQNLTGIEAGPLLASLGIGGLALALAAKEPLMNIFGTFTVLFDKPFKVGDTVIIENYCGVVESVGYRSTRILTLSGALISVPNQKVINSTVENLQQRPYILWQTTIKIAYHTPASKLSRAIEIVKEVLANHEHMSLDRPPRVFFTGFGEWSLDIQVNAWYNVNDWWGYNAWLDTTCSEIKRRFDEEGIDLAIPANMTQLKYNNNMPMEQIPISEGEMVQAKPHEWHATAWPR